jgi:hypothetical protein
MSEPFVPEDLWEAIKSLLPEEPANPRAAAPASRIVPHLVAASSCCGWAALGGDDPKRSAHLDRVAALATRSGE